MYFRANLDHSNGQPPGASAAHTWPLSTFVATQRFGSYWTNSGHAADIEPTLMPLSDIGRATSVQRSNAGSVQLNARLART
jgi:hypothetical protein